MKLYSYMTKWIFLAVLPFFIGIACLSDSHSEESLKKRVHIEWDAKVKKNWEQVYALTVNEYKKKIDQSTFLKRANLNIQEFSVKEVKILEPRKKALAVVDYNIIHQFGVNFRTTAKEEWLWEENEWRLNLVPATGMPGASIPTD